MESSKPLGDFRATPFAFQLELEPDVGFGGDAKSSISIGSLRSTTVRLPDVSLTKDHLAPALMLIVQLRAGLTIDEKSRAIRQLESSASDQYRMSCGGTLERKPDRVSPRDGNGLVRLAMAPTGGSNGEAALRGLQFTADAMLATKHDDVESLFATVG